MPLPRRIFTREEFLAEVNGADADQIIMDEFSGNEHVTLDDLRLPPEIIRRRAIEAADMRHRHDWLGRPRGEEREGITYEPPIGTLHHDPLSYFFGGGTDPTRHDRDVFRSERAHALAAAHKAVLAEGNPVEVPRYSRYFFLGGNSIDRLKSLGLIGRICSLSPEDFKEDDKRRENQVS